MPKYQIIVPVFNEEKILPTILEHALNADYLKNLVIVNDASTDSTSQILSEWKTKHNLKFLHLEKNCKKEGAIYKLMQDLQKKNELAEYTVLIDADTYLESPDHRTVNEQINDAINHLEANKLSALAIRLNAVYKGRPSIFYMSAFTTYIGIQFDNWLLGKQKQLWVINGAGGIFRSQELLKILDYIEFNFETGDLQITVELMKKKEPISFYKPLLANSYVPSTLRIFFNQRRRWERGTTKVIWQDKKFYLSTIRNPSYMALALLIHLSIYLSIITSAIAYLIDPTSWQWSIKFMLYSYLGWFAFDLIKCSWVIYSNKYKVFSWFLPCLLIHGPVTLFITIPSRIYGFFEALKFLIKKNCSPTIKNPSAKA